MHDAMSTMVSIGGRAFVLYTVELIWVYWIYLIDPNQISDLLF